jgi:hypothetical protein
VACTPLLLPKLKPKPGLAWAANIPATPVLIILSVSNINVCKTLLWIRISQSPRTRVIAKKLRFKQASFMDNLIERHSLDFIDLKSSLDSFSNIVLSKVLMSMKSKRLSSRHLFVSVQKAYDGAPVRFQYTSELSTEADALIPVLTLALQGIYGDATDKWCKFSARIGIEGFTFDKGKNRIVPTGNNTLDDLDHT